MAHLWNHGILYSGPRFPFLESWSAMNYKCGNYAFQPSIFRKISGRNWPALVQTVTFIMTRNRSTRSLKKWDRRRIFQLIVPPVHWLSSCRDQNPLALAFEVRAAGPCRRGFHMLHRCVRWRPIWRIRAWRAWRLPCPCSGVCPHTWPLR